MRVTFMSASRSGYRCPLPYTSPSRRSHSVSHDAMGIDVLRRISSATDRRERACAPRPPTHSNLHVVVAPSMLRYKKMAASRRY
jgi:hypothetical protein